MPRITPTLAPQAVRLVLRVHVIPRSKALARVRGRGGRALIHDAANDGGEGRAATDMGCKNANRIVEFTTLFEPFLTSFSVEPQVSQYTIGKLMELASSRCHRHGLKAKYGSMPRWRAEVEVSCTFTRHAGALWGR